MSFRRQTLLSALTIVLVIYLAVALAHDVVATATLSAPGVFRWMFP